MDVLAFGIGKIGSRLVKADKLTNTAQLMINTSNLLSNAASFGMCADAAMATGFDMYNKYYILGQSVDSDTKWEVLSLGMSVLGSVVSAKGMSKSTKELSDLLQKEGFTNALKEEVFGLASGFKRTPDIMPGGSGMGMNLQFFGGGKSGRASTPNTQLSLQQALEELDASGLRPGQTELHMSQLNSALDGIQNNYNPTKAYSSVYSDGTNRYLVEGHHTTVAFKMLGKDNAINMNTATSDLPSATNVYWTKKWYQFWRKTIKIVED